MGARPYLKCSPSARMVSCCTPPIRLKKMARWPPSTTGRERGLVSAGGGREGSQGWGVILLTNEDGLSHAVGQGTGAQK